ncbi:MAG: type II secretion protein ATPase [Micavibrio sp.]|nr:type II secretion protein ATPase [Micavibrio sp.]
MTSETSILLPAAKIGVFAQNAELRQNVQSLVDDWRFARIQIDVAEGDVETAISLYEKVDAHDVIIIETDTVDDSFVQRLEALAQYCSSDTAAIVIGPVNDVNLYRKLISMGVSDYLVHPIAQNALAEVTAKSIIERLGTSGSKLISCIGAKGGVGTSSIAHTLAMAIGEKFQEKTVILDADGAASYLSVSMGGDPTTTLAAAAKSAIAKDKDSIKRMMVKASDKVEALGSGAEAFLDQIISAEQFEDILDMLMEEHPVCVVDLSKAPADLRRSVLARSHKIFVVTQGTVQSLRSARMLLNEIKQLRGEDDKDVSLIHNMKGLFPDQEVPSSEAEKALGHEINYSFDFAPKGFPAQEMEGKKPFSNSVTRKIGEELLKGLTPIMKKELSSKDDAGQGKDSKKILGGFFDKLKK